MARMIMGHGVGAPMTLNVRKNLMAGNARRQAFGVPIKPNAVAAPRFNLKGA